MPLNEEQAYRVMEEKGVDAIISSSPENNFYISDYWSLGQQLRCGTQAYAILPLQGDPVLVAPFNEADLVVDCGTWIDDLRFYGRHDLEVSRSESSSDMTMKLVELYSASQPEVDAVSALLAALDERKLSGKVLALDTSGISAFLFRDIQQRLPKAEILEGANLLWEIRLIKTKAEVERIKRATEITEKSMEDALEIVRPEITELDLAGMFEYSVAYDGGRVTHNLIGVGERSAYPHPVPSTRGIQRGDTIRFTLGCNWMHYQSNISRTALVGRPRSDLKNKWEAVMNAQDSILDALEPGVKLSSLYDVAAKELEEGKLKAVNRSFGHGLGVECNELPCIEEGNEGVLMEGMVLNIDVPYLDLGSGGLQTEDTVLITESGFELLTNTERTLYLL